MLRPEDRALCTGGSPSDAAFTLLEVLFAITLAAIVGAAAAPQLAYSVDDVRAAGAVRYVATKLQQARTDAVARSSSVGWQFVAIGDGYEYARYTDGNDNGVRSRDIAEGIDARIGAPERLRDRFAGVEFDAVPNLPPVEPGGTPPGSDPIRLGSSNILTFTPLGTSSSGSLYIRGRRNIQYAIRVDGETGRVRILKYDPRTARWGPA